eukprot:TRINITY_DN104680_c0_g1_i1.p1 TRINITY_DN104680_c0_g1~~TRINITY_DN104680_c0_g1_i1.p1  ORF type:complete len:216 (-),score=44.86 TRINITY_DN104680_c0_g1_i1:136-696(-)
MTMLDWYWAGMPLFFPSLSALAEMDSDARSCVKAKIPSCIEEDEDKRWELDPHLLYVFLPKQLPCYGQQSPFAAAQEEIDKLGTEEAEGLNMAEWCSLWHGDTPIICFWHHQETRSNWLKHAWYYQMPLIYYWDHPEDLAAKLKDWTWENTTRHKAELERILDDSLGIAKEQLERRLRIVAEETGT